MPNSHAVIGRIGCFQFKTHLRPKLPRDLLHHRCINFRHGSAGLYRWEFEKGKKSLSVSVNGPLAVDDLELVTRASIDGVGLAFMSEEHTEPHFATGAPVRVLEEWCQAFPGFFLLLSESPTAVGRPIGPHQGAAALIFAR